MARKRARRTHCPACDELLEAELSEAPSPCCPACGERLVPVVVAPLWRRIAASVVDATILLATAGMLNLLLLQLADGPALLGDASGIDRLLRVLELDVADLLRPIAPLILMSAIYLVLFWTLTGRTPGARLLKLRVIDERGRPPKPVWAVLRVVAHLAGLAAGALGWIWTALDPERRALHDHVARTYVVRDT